MKKSEPRVISFATVPLDALEREAAKPAFCRNCGDSFRPEMVATDRGHASERAKART